MAMTDTPVKTSASGSGHAYARAPRNRRGHRASRLWV
ncbi:hypothetical protein SALBM135S_03697 [Streptomyces alboniger]